LKDFQNQKDQKDEDQNQENPGQKKLDSVNELIKKPGKVLQSSKLKKFHPTLWIEGQRSSSLAGKTIVLGVTGSIGQSR